MNVFQRIKTIWRCRKELLLDQKIRVDLIAFKKQWRADNSQNLTTAGCKFDTNKVEVGKGTYGTLNVHCWDNPAEHLKIGDYCSIAEDVHFLLGGMHKIHRITTYPYLSHVMGRHDVEPTGTKGPIVIEDDVWICYGATILSGVTVGKGSIISAKSVVAKDVPPYSIVIDGEVKKKRFPNEVIEKIKDIDLDGIKRISDPDTLRRIVDTDLTAENVDSIISEIE